MKGIAFAELFAKQAGKAFPDCQRFTMDHTQSILTAVTEPDPASDAAFIERHEARPIESSHALIRIPSIEGFIKELIGSSDRQATQPALPAFSQVG